MKLFLKISKGNRSEICSEEDALILSILNQKYGGILDLSGIDTEVFLYRAIQEGLSGRLFKELKEKGLLHLFPPGIQTALRESYLLTSARNMVLMNDLKALLSCLEKDRVRTIVLKGAALLERIYPDIGVRPMIDIDLLFYDEEIEEVGGDSFRAGRILGSLGYRLISACPLIYSNDRTTIDIHTDVNSFSRFGTMPYAPHLSTSALWERSLQWSESTRSEADGFRYVRILSPEDTVLTLSIHIVKHSFLHLMWIIDIIEIIRGNPEINWKRLVEIAREAGFEKLLFYVFSYLMQFSPVIPEEFLLEIMPQRLGLIEKKIMQRIMKNQRRDGYGDILYLCMIPGALRKIQFVRNILFPAEEKSIKRALGLMLTAGRLVWNYISDKKLSAEN